MSLKRLGEPAHDSCSRKIFKKDDNENSYLNDKDTVTKVGLSKVNSKDKIIADQSSNEDLDAELEAEESCYEEYIDGEDEEEDGDDELEAEESQDDYQDSNGDEIDEESSEEVEEESDGDEFAPSMNAITNASEGLVRAVEATENLITIHEELLTTSALNLLRSAHRLCNESWKHLHQSRYEGTNILNIPELGLANITNFLNFKDNANLRLVCKMFNYVVSKYSMEFNTWYINLNSEVSEYDKYTFFRNSATRLNITLPSSATKVYNASNGTISRLGEFVNNYAYRITGLTTNGFAIRTLWNSFKEIKTLKTLVITDQNFVLEQSLKSFLINNSSTLKEMVLKSVNLSYFDAEIPLNGLEKLTLEDCVSSAGVERLLSKCSASLIHLTVKSNCPAFLKEANFTFSKLEYLCLKGGIVYTGQLLKCCAETLQHLRIEMTQAFTASICLLKLAQEARLLKLKSFSLENVLSNGGLQVMLTEYASTLTVLEIKDCLILDNNLDVLPDNNIRILRVVKCRQFNSLKHLLKPARNSLEELSIQECPTRLLHKMDFCLSKLAKLSLDYCGSRGVITLIASAAISLKDLHLACMKENLLKQLTKDLTALQRLSLYKIHHEMDTTESRTCNGISKLLSHCKDSIEKLDIVDTRANFNTWSQLLPRLKKVRVCDNKLMSTISKVVRKAPILAVFEMACNDQLKTSIIMDHDAIKNMARQFSSRLDIESIVTGCEGTLSNNYVITQYGTKKDEYNILSCKTFRFAPCWDVFWMNHQLPDLFSS